MSEKNNIVKNFSMYETVIIYNKFCKENMDQCDGNSCIENYKLIFNLLVHFCVKFPLIARPTSSKLNQSNIA